jgi:hypothetical protein
MPRREVTGRKPGGSAQRAIEGPSPAVYDIPGFCSSHKISPDLYYHLKRIGEGPDTMKVGARTLISYESAARWRAKCEAPRKPAPKRNSADRMAEAAPSRTSRPPPTSATPRNPSSRQPRAP